MMDIKVLMELKCYICFFMGIYEVMFCIFLFFGYLFWEIDVG